MGNTHIKEFQNCSQVRSFFLLQHKRQDKGGKPDYAAKRNENKCEDWLTGCLFDYLFLCLFDDANWSKYRGDVGEVIWFTRLMVTWGCCRVLSLWWVPGLESAAPTPVGNLIIAGEETSHICAIIPTEWTHWRTVKFSLQIKGIMSKMLIMILCIFLVCAPP